MENSKNILKGSIIAGSVIGLTLYANARSSNIVNFEALGTGSELRANLLENNSISSGVKIEFTCGDGTCGEASCGEKSDKKLDNKADTETVEHKDGEHKCGEGSCGEKSENKLNEKDSKKVNNKEVKEHSCGEHTCGGH